MLFVQLLYIFVLYCLYIVLAVNLPEVTITQGTLRGTYDKTVNNRQFIAFLGIPYAKPPTGDHRFKEPVAAEPWIGVYNATTVPEACLQYDHFKYLTPFAVHGSEDCLYLNVFTPKLPNELGDKLLNVIVHIHGGAFMFSSGSNHRPHKLLDRDVVYIAINYRLGSLGFLSTEDNIVPGNNGLKDQTLALKWIQQNIAVFGGDPNSVTITGLSAGGTSVHYHLLSPLSTGLFKGGMSVSGSVLCPWSLAEHSREKAFRLAELLGCPTSQTNSMVECMRSRPARQIVAQTKVFMPWLYNPYSPFGPVVEPASPTAFISEPPLTTITQGKAQDVPWVIGFTSEEGLYPGAEIVCSQANLDELQDNWNQYLPHILDYNFTAPIDSRDELARKILEYYKVDLKNREGRENLIKMIGDRLFVHGIIKAAKLHAKHYNSPVYVYKFSYRGKSSIGEHFCKENYGVGHGDDLFYVIHSHVMDTRATKNDKSMTEELINFWIDFAANGKLSEPWVSLNNVTQDPTLVDIRSSDNWKQTVIVNVANEQFWDSLDFNENILHFQGDEEDATPMRVGSKRIEL